MSTIKREAVGLDGRRYRIMDDGLAWLPGGGIYSIEVCQMYGDCAVWKKVYDGGRDFLATYKEFRRLTS